MARRISFGVLFMVACGVSEPPRSSPSRIEQHDARRSIIDDALASREAARFAASLANDVGPRLTGSKGDTAAVAWAQRTMKEIGLTNIHAEPVVAPVWRRGEERLTMLSSPPVALAITALGWSGATPEGGVEAEVVRVATLAALAALPDDAVRGRIVFFDPPKMRRTADGSGYGESVPIRSAGPKAAQLRGAAAAIVRSIGTDPSRPHTGATSRGLEASFPAVAISNDDADVLQRTSSQRVRLVVTSQTDRDVTTANVVGEVRGSTRPEEIIVLGAHLDSWDLGGGAIDDAAGCGVVLDAARLVSPRRPERTVRVVLFAAEESSLAGSRAYAQQHASEADQHVVALEVDEGTYRIVSLGFRGDGVDAFRGIALPLARLGVRIDLEQSWPGADLRGLVELGVPTVNLQQDATTYFDIHHTSADTAAALDPEALAQATAVVAHVAYEAAHGSRAFGRVPEALRKR